MLPSYDVDYAATKIAGSEYNSLISDVRTTEMAGLREVNVKNLVRERYKNKACYERHSRVQATSMYWRFQTSRTSDMTKQPKWSATFS